jgi:hypothetical protein
MPMDEEADVDMDVCVDVCVDVNGHVLGDAHDDVQVRRRVRFMCITESITYM